MDRVPEGWSLVYLEQVADIQTGLAKGQNNFRDPVSMSYLRVANVQAGYLDLSVIKNITVERSEVDRYSLRFEDVLLTEGGDNNKLGRGTIWLGEIPNCLHQNHIFVARPHRDLLDPYYLAYLTNSPYGKLYFRKSAKQSTNLASINSTQLKAFPVLLPPLAEQRRIAEIIGAWDDAIALTGRLIDALKRRKQGLMQRLLTGEVRFGEFEGQDNWQALEFGNFVKRNGEQLNPLTETVDFPCIELEHLAQETGEILGHVSFLGQKSIKNHFYPGQVLFGKLRPYLRKYAQPDFEGVCSSEIWVLTSKENTCGDDYLYFLVQTQGFINAANATSGTKMPRADWNHVVETIFPIPVRDEQNKIVEMLHALDTEIRLFAELESRYAIEKKGLMQRLLTGEIRVGM